MAKIKNQKNKDEISKLYKHLTLGPEIRGEEPKGEYPNGRIKQVFAVFSQEMNTLMRMNCWFILFVVPLFFVVYWCTNYYSNLALSGFNFVGNLGMAYPGGSNTSAEGAVALYSAYQFVLYLTVPCIFILGIAFAGMFNVTKAALWGEKMDKITKMFFRGVKKFWWKYLIITAIDAFIILGIGTAFIYFCSMKAQGLLVAGHYVMIVFVSIFGFLIMYPNMLILPLIAELDVPFTKLIKDALILSLKMAPIGLPLFAVCLLPLALLALNSTFFIVIVVVLLAMFGTSLYGLIFTGFSQYALDNVVTPLYKMSINPKILEKTKKQANKPQDFKKAQPKKSNKK